jgi:3-oxoacyl-[acyl-carrier-protein] synthase II
VKRVVVTGIGVVSPLGNTRNALLTNLAQGHAAIRRITGPHFERLETPLAAPADFNADAFFDAPQLRMLDRVSQFALHAARNAVSDAKLEFDDDKRQQCGVFLGTGMGGAHSTDEGYWTVYGERSERVKPFSVLMAMNNAAAGWIGLEYRITGPNFTYSTACSSSAVAIGEAWQRIAQGELQCALAGGCEAPLTFGTLKAWEAMRTLATEDEENPAASCKPFSRNRSGLILGEGAAIVLLEDRDHALARGAPIYAELAGYGTATDIAHITRPSVQGQARAMALALKSAQLPPSSIGYINAHGTGTVANDPVETAAIKQVFGEHAQRLAVSSTKAMHGHLLGAAGALEFVITVLALHTHTLFPTLHLQQADPECDLDYVPHQARLDVPVEAAMSNSFAFGGTNAVLVAARHAA